MTLSQIHQLLHEHPVGAAGAVILLSLVTVRKLELPVWGWITSWLKGVADRIGNALNASTNTKIGELLTEVQCLRTEVGELKEAQQKHEAVADRRQADLLREHILHFNTELTNGIYHDRESYVETLAVIDRYHAYCAAHPEYPNSRATAAVANIKRNYDHKLKVGFHKEDS